MTALVAVLVAVGAAAQTDTPQASADPIRAILDEASSSPPEIYADIAFDLLDKGRVAQEDEVPLLEDVFRKAASATEPFRPRYASSAPLSGLAEIRWGASDLELDALSIRCHAVQRMLDIDPVRGRALFEEITPPSVPRSSCTDEFVPDAGIYLETVAAVYEEGEFTAEEQEKNLPWLMIDDAVRRTTTSWEAVTAFRSLPALVETEEEADRLAVALAASLNIGDDDRGFTSAVLNGELVSLALAANEKLTAAGAPGAPILAALRQYLVRHLYTAVRCSDSETAFSKVVEQFNTAVRSIGEVPKLTDEEMTPANLEGEAERSRYANAADFEQLYAETEALSDAGPGEGIARARLTEEWADRAKLLAAKIQEWKGQYNQDPIEVFHQKFRLFRKVFDIAPAGTTHDLVTREMITLLEDGTILQRAPAEWLYELGRLRMYQRLFTLEVLASLASVGGIEGLPFESGLEVSEVLAGSRLSALSLYGRIALLELSSQD